MGDLKTKSDNRVKERKEETESQMDMGWYNAGGKHKGDKQERNKAYNQDQ